VDVEVLVNRLERRIVGGDFLRDGVAEGGGGGAGRGEGERGDAESGGREGAEAHGKVSSADGRLREWRMMREIPT